MSYNNCREDTPRCSLFVDNGAWHAYALSESAVGFEGPYLLTRNYGYWIDGRFGDFRVSNVETGELFDTAAANIRSWSEPGRILQTVSWDSLQIDLTLIFSDARTAALQVEMKNLGAIEQTFGITLHNQRGSSMASLERDDSGANVMSFSDSDALIRTRWHSENAGEVIAGGDYAYSIRSPVKLAAGETHRSYVTQASFVNGDDYRSANTVIADDLPDAFDENRRRWGRYLSNVLSRNAVFKEEPKLARLAVKAIQTLTSNWRGAAGDLCDDGIYPSYAIPDFNGVWSWDTWKQAVATAYFDAELAQRQIRGMFCYQNERGMVADVIYYDKSENNWRDTKPPLAAWAVWHVYQSSADDAFLEELYPKLLAYHRWWYVDRDHDNDGIAEFGSTDGTRLAAAWESGMDNAVRFDQAEMLQNNEHAWSLNQESVDLNSYLYAEKKILAQIADALGDTSDAAILRDEAARVREHIQRIMYDDVSGFFYDTSLDGSAKILVQAAEGWSPLWTGVATDDQAQRVIESMLDADKFATYLPFPTLSAEHLEFQPHDGYWRGPVWMDQAWFATRALQQNNAAEAAQEMRERLVNNAQGLVEQAPIFENYDPLTGEGIEAPHFSWSAAHYLMLLNDYRQ